MTEHIQKQRRLQIQVRASQERQTGYAGIAALQRVWQRLDVAGLLAQAGIHYGQGCDKAADFAFALTVGPLAQAHSVRRVAQRFGGERSPQAVEGDALLNRLVRHRPDQRTLSRFVQTERYSWLAFQQACVQWLQQQPETCVQAEGVLIVDDFPLPKPYARHMAYLQKVWDANLRHAVLGYHMVHLYYYHPQISYSLMVEAWRKTSLSGECDAKPTHAHRRAKPGEERSKLDIALDGLAHFLPLLADKPTVVFDGWYFARWFVASLSALGVAWVTQAGVQRKFAVGEQYASVPALIAHYRERLTPVVGLERPVRAYAVPAILRPDKYIRQPQAVLLVFVQGLLAQDAPDAIRVLVCNRPDWPLVRILTCFGYRSQIEQAHRTGKQLAGWTDFHCRSWPSLQAHWALALLRSLLLTLLPLWTPPLQPFSLAQIIEHGLQAAARLHLDLAQAVCRLYLPRGHPVLQACCSVMLCEC
jgi:hypothetical protein